jgi:hypothetical protein
MPTTSVRRFTGALLKARRRDSMDRRGRCMDNVLFERFGGPAIVRARHKNVKMANGNFGDRFPLC